MRQKKIIVNISEELVSKADAAAKKCGVSRSCLVRTALEEYLNKMKKDELKQSLKDGYRDMGDVNLSIAEMCFDADNDEFFCYEEKLSESD